MIKYRINGKPIKHILNNPRHYGYFQFLIKKGLSPDEAYAKTIASRDREYRGIKYFIDGKPLKCLLDARDLKYFYSIKSRYHLTIDEALKRVKIAINDRKKRWEKYRMSEEENIF